MEKKIKKAYCPVDYAFQRIGGKYKGRIIWLLREGCLRYGELLRVVEGVSPKMLTQALKELEEDRLVVRKAYHVVPPHVEYSLSEIGTGLLPFIDQMRIWGQQQMEGEAALASV
jgi:DNA-binding HxlR family transcriptional regulator